MNQRPLPISIGLGMQSIEGYGDWENPRLLTHVILSRPLRGTGTKDDPYYRAVRLTLTDGSFVCEIQPQGEVAP